ncbi:response regulator transcription factor [Kutzneria viridogrisea]|uniref:Uncharacterized protein n=2 Tax=Kutzneria TaxID=43356 RepID=W5WIF0_9PSEU|nr:response regulator transcription factor [Kutzneria albida]AHI00979.1 hypothetical protein KALB_7621 [Kutzneria albida DSM 43870]MBA8926256.1 DNA-binding NarL/FixJ family response regulator [Kutzneria viridogrisea]
MTGPILIVDDHAVVATSLALALRSQGFDAIRCPVGSAAEVLSSARREQTGLALVDLDLGNGLCGAELVGPLRTLGWRVLIVTGTEDRAAIAAAVVNGAVGWVCKSAPFPVLVDAVQAAAAGRTVLSAAERAELLRVHQGASAVTELLGRLSGRERQVLDQLVAGHRAARIAQEFVVSVATVRAQIRSILSKLEVRSQLEAVALARSGRVGAH